MINHIAAHQFEAHVIKTNKKLVIVDFWAPWCQPCKMMDPVFLEVQGNFVRDLDVIKINVDDEQKLAQVYNVRSIPTMLFFMDVKGENDGKKIVHSEIGFVSKADLMKKVIELLS